MALESGTYTFTNVRNHNWAVLLNDDDGSDAVAGSSMDDHAGEKWVVRKTSSRSYILQNQRHKNYATYHPLDTACDRPTVLSTRTGTARPWKIEKVDGHDVYVIFNLRKDLCWTLRHLETLTPITLEDYEVNDSQHWEIVPEGISTLPVQPCRSLPLCNGKHVLSLDAGGFGAISSLIVLDYLMKEIAVDSADPPAPCEVFDLICGTSFGGFIAILLGRLGLPCQVALSICFEIILAVYPNFQIPFGFVHVADLDDRFERCLKNILRRYEKSKGSSMATIQRSQSTRLEATRTFVTTVPHHHDVVYRIRSYRKPRCEMETAPVGYDWTIWGAARGTCGVHPASTPIRIIRNSIPYRFGDPSQAGHSNPTMFALKEAQGLFPGDRIVVTSIGAGLPIQGTDENAFHGAVDAYKKLQMIAVAAEKVHQEIIRNTEMLPQECYLRLNPVRRVEDMMTISPERLEHLTHEWLQSEQGRLKVTNVVSKLLGVPPLRPPPPPPSTNPGYNPILDEKRPEELGSYLNLYDVMFLIDDSGSMLGSRWEETGTALSGIAKRAMEIQTGGVGIQFLNSKVCVSGVKGVEEVQDIFDKISPRGRTPTGKRLRKILENQIARLDAALLAGPDEYRQIQPLDLIIITDGKASDNPREELVKIATGLQQKNHHPNIIGIQFVQIGDDNGAREDLRALARLGSKVANMVDTVPYTSSLTPERLERILLGGLHPNVRAQFQD